MDWDKRTKEQLDQMLEKVPVFLRSIAQEKVSQRAEKYAGENNHREVCEKDLIDAFFKETPFGFHGPMKTDMESIGLDYAKYGYQK